MYPQTHIISGLIFVIILGIFTTLPPLALFIILAASFLIDVDHWLVYVSEKKDLSIGRSYRWFVDNAKKHKKQGRKFLCIFHTIEFFMVIFILSFFSNIAFYIAIGCSLHLFLDLVYSYVYKKESRKPLSIISWIFFRK